MSTDRAAICIRQQGLTLIELLMFIVIISVALLGILTVLNMTSARSADPLRRKQAIAIAESLLEEVQLARFTYCDPTDARAELAEQADATPTGCATAAGIEAFGQEAAATAAGVTRPFDNINDYVSAADTQERAFDVAGVLADAAGDPIPVPGYRATLRITPEELGQIPSGNTALAMDVVRIRVTVYYDNDNVTLDGYRTRFAPTAVP